VDCDELDDLIEAIAEGQRPSGDQDAHLASCARCQARMRLAVALDRMLAAREAAEPPSGFTGRVMARVAQEQWRAERIVDAGFNLAVAAGLAAIAVGLMGLAWGLGWLGLERPTLQAVESALAPWINRTMAEAQTVALAALLLTSALGLWWWVEGEEAS
jgi:anti-sigma factor RsiW